MTNATMPRALVEVRYTTPPANPRWPEPETRTVWERTERICPSCGTGNLWVDVLELPQTDTSPFPHLCVDCGAVTWMQAPDESPSEVFKTIRKQLLKALR